MLGPGGVSREGEGSREKWGDTNESSVSIMKETGYLGRERRRERGKKSGRGGGGGKKSGRRGKRSGRRGRRAGGGGGGDGGVSDGGGGGGGAIRGFPAMARELIRLRQDFLLVRVV